MDTVPVAITEPVRRLEVFTGAGRRRKWSPEDKARIVAEIATSGDSVCAVARRHGLSPQQLFGWRRQVKESQAILSEAEELRFVPAIADAASPAVGRQRKVRRCMIEVEIDGAIVRIDRDADAKMIAAVLHALTASR